MNRWAARLAAGLLALACASSLAACASLPTSPGVQPVDATQSAAGPGAAGARSMPMPPDPSWTPEQVVAGFLSASADSIQIAKLYLAPGYRATWNPEPWTATVVDQSPSLAAVPQSKVTVGTHTTVVILTPKYLASLNSSVGSSLAGNLVSAKPRQYLFELTQSAGGWRITHLDSATMLMLTEPDFVRDYQPRNLYFFAGPSSSVLVPEPVFVPEQANIDPTQRAKGLVKALLLPPTGWLSGAAVTAFPPGAKLNDLQASGGDAVVDLGGAAARASAYQRQQMAAQLVWTLTSSSYSVPDIRSVEVKFNGQPWQGGAQLLISGSSYGSQVPLVSYGPLYYLSAGAPQGPPATQGANIRKWSPGGPSVPVPLPRGVSKVSFSVIAVSPAGSPAQFAGCSRNSVYVSAFDRAADVRTFTLNAGCSALSWDSGGNLWLAAGHTIYVITPGGGLTQVGEPLTLTRDTVVALRVAPDGVRMALIVSTPAGTNQVLMAAISRDQMFSIGSGVSVGSDLIHPVALSWYDPDHLVVLDQPAAGSAQMYEVPLDGGASAQLSTASGSVSVAVSNWGIVLGTSSVNQQQIVMIPRPNGQWQQIGAGAAVVFPG